MEYSTTDFGEATALVTSGKRLNRMEKTKESQSKAAFIFTDDGTIEATTEKYYSGDLQGSLHMHNMVYKELKSRTINFLRK